MSVVRPTAVLAFDSPLEDNQLSQLQELWRDEAVSAAAQESGIACTRGPFCESPVATLYTIVTAARTGQQWPLEKVQVGVKALAHHLNHGNTFPGFVSVAIEADQLSQVNLTKATVKIKCAFPLSNEQLTSVRQAWCKALSEAVGGDTTALACNLSSTIGCEYCIEAILRTCTQLTGADGDIKRERFKLECGQRFKAALNARADLPKAKKVVIDPERFVMDLCGYAAPDWTPVAQFKTMNETESVHRSCRRCGQTNSFLALSHLKESCEVCGNLQFRERLLINLSFVTQTQSWNSAVKEDDYQVVCNKRQADVLMLWQRKCLPIHTSMRILEPRNSTGANNRQDQWRLCCAADLEDDDDDQQMRW